jgi:hypothetical protein
MALERDARSITDVARTLLDDVRDLFREEIALARAEFRQELGHAQSAGARLGAGLGLAAVGGVMVLFAIGRAVATWFGWPVWGGYGLIGIVLLFVGWGVTSSGRHRLQQVRGLPETSESLKHTASWAADRVSPRS